MNIQILAPTQKAITQTKFKEYFEDSLFQIIPFEQKLLNYLSSLSSHLIKRKESKLMPELMALGFWLRRSNLEKIKKEFFLHAKKSVINKPRGVVFHIAPKNVDTIFIYSWALSFLSGNHNIVRISSSGSSLISIILDEISALADTQEYDFINQTQSFLTYARNDDINSFFSQIANVRMIWGGDETVSIFKQLKTKPNTKDICFANKESIACIKSSACLKLDEERSLKVTEDFYNDSYWFDQMACSSPKFIFFMGSKKENILCSSLFEKSLNRVLKKKDHYEDITASVSKLKNIFLAASKKNYLKSYDPASYDKATFIDINPEEFLNSTMKCQSGTFGKVFIEDIFDLDYVLKDNFQTLVYFGFSHSELEEFIHSNTKTSIDRVVPFGQALNFDKTWDGHDLMNELVRHVNLI